MRWRIVLALMVLWAAEPLCAQPALRGGGGAERAGWERYEVVVRRSIFARDRGRRPGGMDRPGQAAGDPGQRGDGGDGRPADAVGSVSPDPGAQYVLAGVSHVGEAYVAFFERITDGEVREVRVDERIAGRRITRITLDAVEVSRDGSIGVIPIGRTLAGTAPAARPGGGPGASSVSSDGVPGAPRAEGGGNGESPEDASDEVLQRLRRRRQQELSP